MFIKVGDYLFRTSNIAYILRQRDINMEVYRYEIFFISGKYITVEFDDMEFNELTTLFMLTIN